MKTDEFAFMNEQLAGMLRQGIPLEGALRELSRTMAKGDLRDELSALGSDLTTGMPLDQALNARKLPSFYVVMLKAGARTDRLPDMLTTLGDYYTRVNAIELRLKGLLMYPAIVLVFATVVSIFVARSLELFLREYAASSSTPLNAIDLPTALVAIWTPAFIIAAICILVAIVALTPPLRRLLRWRLPAFREAAIARVSSAIAALLKGGGTLDEALTIARELETDGAASRELAAWQERARLGCPGFPGLAEDKGVFPPLYAWLVEGSGEDLPGGFERAGRFYFDRANRRCDLMLGAVLPTAIVALGCAIVGQFAPMLNCLKETMEVLTR